MTRPLAAALLALAALLTACSEDGPPDVTGDSVVPNTQTEAPVPVPESS